MSATASASNPNPWEPMDDPTNRALMRLMAARLAAAYAVNGRTEMADEWAAVAFAVAGPPPVRSMADA